MADEAEHYRLVRKKYKRAKKVVNFVAGGLGGLSAVLSSAGFATALSGIGIPVAIPLGAVGGIFSVSSSVLFIGSKEARAEGRAEAEIELQKKLQNLAASSN